jgi:catechol 2,3-dioxygenase-like lactoylglutathione lyase family enzyme
MEALMGMIVNIAVADLEETEIFYREVLGFALEKFIPVPGHPPIMMLHAGDAVVLFRELAALEALHPALFQNIYRHPLGVGCSLQLTVPDVDQVKHRLVRQKRHLLYEMDDEEHGFREIWVHDPDGYLVILDQARKNEPGEDNSR